MKLSFTVFGIPQPQGSARAFMHKGAKFPVITSTNPKMKPWRQEIAGTAQSEMARLGLSIIKKGPIKIEASFIFQKPQSTKRSLIYKETKPDLDKLIRALCDAMTGIVFRDDAQVCRCELSKVFGLPSRAEITVSQIQ